MKTPKTLGVFLRWYYRYCQKNIVLVYRGERQDNWAKRCLYLDANFHSVLGYNHRSILDCEVVFEYDESDSKLNSRLVDKVIKKLNSDNIKYAKWFSGNKSMHCLPTNEEVFVKSKGRVSKVRLYQLHNMVQTGQDVEIKAPSGFVKVLSSTRRKQNKDEKLCKFKLDNGKVIVCSKDHRFPVLSDNKYTLKEAKDIKKSDRFISSLDSIEGDNIGNYDLGRYIGLFLADGNYNKSGINFTFHKDEEHLAEFVKTEGEKFGAYSNITRKDNYIRITTSSQGIKSLMEEFCVGTVAKNKGVRSKTYGMNFNLRRGILNGWLEGDGLHGQYQDGESISKGLVKAMYAIATSLGIHCHMSAFVYEHIRRYRLHIIKNPKIEYKTNITNPPENCVYTNIRYANHNYTEKKTELIDIEVDSGDHLFTLANGIITHNCHIILKNYDVTNLSLFKNVVMRHYGTYYVDKNNNIWENEGEGRRKIYPDLKLATKGHLIRAEFGVHEKTQDNKELIFMSPGYPTKSKLPLEIFEKYQHSQELSVKQRVNQSVSEVAESETVKKLLNSVLFREGMNDGRERVMYQLIQVLKHKFKPKGDEVGKRELTGRMWEWYKYSSTQGLKMTEENVRRKVVYHWNQDYPVTEQGLLKTIEEVGGKL